MPEPPSDAGVRLLQTMQTKACLEAILADAKSRLMSWPWAGVPALAKEVL